MVSQIGMTTKRAGRQSDACVKNFEGRLRDAKFAEPDIRRFVISRRTTEKHRDPWRAILVSVASFASAASHSLVKGFAIGHRIFADTAKANFTGTLSAEAAIDDMAGRYRRLCDIWDKGRP